MKIEVIFCELEDRDTSKIRERVFDVPAFSNAVEIERALRLQIEGITGQQVVQMAWCRHINVDVEQYRGDKALEGAHANGLEWALNAAKARGHDEFADVIEQELTYFERQ
jgi:hypothetical protein